MAQLANCPQCDHDLLVPEGVAEGSWVRCPGCQSFFQLAQARARELPTVEVIAAAPEPTAEVDRGQPTLDDVTLAATLAEMAQIESGLPDEIEEVAEFGLNDGDEVPEQTADDLGFGDLKALFDSNEVTDANQPRLQVEEAAHFGDEEDSESPDADIADANEGWPVNIEAATDKLAFEEPKEIESPEAAAERIDAWFKSAQTLADIPAVQKPDVDYRADHESLFGPSPAASNNATVDIGSGGFQDLSDDFELNPTDESEQDVAAWDDTTHMDRLLSQLDDRHPEIDAAAHDGSAADEQQPTVAMPLSSATADALKIVPKSGRPRRRRSIVRSVVMTAVGGVMGLAAGYYALLWIRGPEIDFLEAAKFLPQAILPPSFKAAPGPMSAMPPLQAKNEKETPERSEDAAPVHDTIADEKASDTPAASPSGAESSSEKLASFEERLNDQKPAEPALLDSPPAAPLKESEPIAAPIQIKDAPSFTVAELSAALEAGKEAEAGLVTGNLGDSRESDRAKGFSYSILADLAQKTTFVEGGSASEAGTLQQEAEDLFRRILSDPRSRNEVGQVVLRWIASPNRKQGGVFLAGNLQSCEARGPVSECSVTLPSGQTLPVLVPAPAADRIGSRSSVAVVGWIVDDPAKQVTGYTGTESRAIFAPKLIPLE